MPQLSLLPVNVVHVVPSAAVGVDGADLKWIARGDDGYEYAMKTVGESHTLPLSEWVCYALRVCEGLRPTFECVDLQLLHGQTALVRWPSRRDVQAPC